MSDQLEWTSTLPDLEQEADKRGWYWVYQAIPKGAGESFVPVWIESNQTLPLFATAFYGPIFPPEMPLAMRPLVYQEKILKAQEEAEMAQKEVNEIETPGQTE